MVLGRQAQTPRVVIGPNARGRRPAGVRARGRAVRAHARAKIGPITGATARALRPTTAAGRSDGTRATARRHGPTCGPRRRIAPCARIRRASDGGPHDPFALRLTAALRWLAAGRAATACDRPPAPAATAQRRPRRAGHPAAGHAFGPAITAERFRRARQACSPPTNSKAARPAAPGEEKTVDYLEAQFERLGLKPGNGDSYFQTVPMVETTRRRRARCSSSTSTASRATLKFGTDMVIGTRTGKPRGEGRRQRAGVRRLRRQRAGAELERLRRRRREGQDGGDVRQRPGLPQPATRRCSKASG